MPQNRTRKRIRLHHRNVVVEMEFMEDKVVHYSSKEYFSGPKRNAAYLCYFLEGHCTLHHKKENITRSYGKGDTFILDRDIGDTDATIKKGTKYVCITFLSGLPAIKGIQCRECLTKSKGNKYDFPLQHFNRTLSIDVAD